MGKDMQANKFTFFWKVDKANGFLSNWYPSNFTINDKKYSNAEQYMMEGKALVHAVGEYEEINKNIATKIMKEPKPAKMKNLGRKVQGFDEKSWNEKGYKIVLEGCYQKFNQNPELKSKLISTGDSTLVEASPVDKKWGIGLAESDSDAKCPSKWKGENLLGKVLMEVRGQLKNNSNDCSEDLEQNQNLKNKAKQDY